MPAYKEATLKRIQGIFMENGSGGFMGGEKMHHFRDCSTSSCSDYWLDLIFNGGKQDVAMQRLLDAKS